MKKLLVLSLLTPLLLLAGCDDAPTQVQVTDPNPAPQVVQGQPAQQQPQVVYVQPEQQPQSPTVVYQQAPQQPVVVQQHDSSGSLLTGMMLGHMMSGGGRSNHTTVINRTYTKKVYVPTSRSYSSRPARRSYGRRR